MSDQAEQTPIEDFRIGGVRIDPANRSLLRSAIFIMGQLVYEDVIPLDQCNEDWFSSRFWEGVNLIATSLRKFDKNDWHSLSKPGAEGGS